MQLIRLRNKEIRILNYVPLQDHIIPHHEKLGSLKFRDMVKMYTRLSSYMIISVMISRVFSISHASE